MANPSTKAIPIEKLLPHMTDEAWAWADNFFPMVKDLKIRARKRMAAKGLISPEEIYGARVGQ